MKIHTLSYIIFILAFSCFGQKSDDAIKARKYKAMALEKLRIKENLIGKAYLDTAIMLDKNYDTAYYNRGTLALFTGDYQSALYDLNTAIELNSNDIEYYCNRGRAYFRLEKYSQALKDFNKVIEKRKELAIVYSFRGSTYDYLKKWKKAFTDFNKAVELDSLNPENYADRAMIELKLDEYNNAEFDCDKGLTMDSTRANTGLLLYLRGLARLSIKGKETDGKKDLIDAASLGYQLAIDILGNLNVTKFYFYIQNNH